MAYLIHNPNVAVYRLAELTGTDDAILGSVAVDEDGNKYALTAGGWLDVTGSGVADGQTVTVVDGEVSVEITIADGVATIPEGYTLSADE